MGSTISRAIGQQNGSVQVPPGYETPTFPSLYTPRIKATIDGEGIFLYNADDVWQFTVLWMIILLVLIYAVCSVFATFTLFLSMSRARLPAKYLNHGWQSDNETKDTGSTSARPPDTPMQMDSLRSDRPKPLTPFSPISPSARSDAPLVSRASKPHRRRRPPILPILLIPVVVTGLGLLLGFIIGTILGFALATVYSTGNFLMSTWIPFLWSLIMALIIVLGSYSTLTAIL